MNAKNLLIGGILGGILFFLLGWLIYGNMLNEYYAQHPGTATGVDKAMDKFEWWALALGNVFSGLLLAYVFTKSGVSTLSSGLITGGVLGFLSACSIDLIMYGTTNIMSKHILVADIVATTVMWAVVGAIVGAIMGRTNRVSVNTSNV